MATKAKIAFGALERIDEALSANKIDAFDVLLVKDENGKPYIGWIDKDGQKVIVSDSAEFAALEAALATKVNAEEVEAQIATKTEDLMKELDTKIDEKIADSAIVCEIVEF